jgi:hypothetical protein
MTIVDAIETKRVNDEIESEIKNSPPPEEEEIELIKNGDGTLVQTDVYFTKHNGKVRRGFYIDENLKANWDNYLIKGVKHKWDGIFLISGMEGSAKSTNAFTNAKYLDPTFPGPLLSDGTTRRKCDRIVFTAQQFLHAIDTAKPEQCIVFDEAVMAFMSQDAGSEIQKILVKKMVTIRKLRLYIIIVIPSIFLLRMYMAVFRTRCMVHYYSPDGITRGFFKFYSYDTKRKLYIKGKKEFDQDCVMSDFTGRATDTSWFFFDDDEYQAKKNEAIKMITETPDKKKKEASEASKRLKFERDVLIYDRFLAFKAEKKNFDEKDMADHLTKKFGFMVTEGSVKGIIKNAKIMLTLKSAEIIRKHEDSLVADNAEEHENDDEEQEL